MSRTVAAGGIALVELTETQFVEIVGVQADDSTYAEGDDRRQHGRALFGSRARIFPLIDGAGGNGCPVLIRDISPASVGFMFEEELAVGDEFIVQIPRQDGTLITIQCMVHRCEPGGTGLVQWVIGATFELVLDTEQWQSTRPEVPASERGSMHFAPTAPAPTTKDERNADRCLPTPSRWKNLAWLTKWDRSSSKIRNRLKRNESPAAAECPAVVKATPAKPGKPATKAASTTVKAEASTKPANEPAVESPAVEIEPTPISEAAMAARPSLFLAPGAEPVEIKIPAAPPEIKKPAPQNLPLNKPLPPLAMTAETQQAPAVQSAAEAPAMTPAASPIVPAITTAIPQAAAIEATNASQPAAVSATEIAPAVATIASQPAVVSPTPVDPIPPLAVTIAAQPAVVATTPVNPIPSLMPVAASQVVAQALPADANRAAPAATAASVAPVAAPAVVVSPAELSGVSCVWVTMSSVEMSFAFPSFASDRPTLSLPLVAPISSGKPPRKSESARLVRGRSRRW